MGDWWVQLVQVTNMSPWFKGGTVTLTGLLALLFAVWMRARWREPIAGSFLVFIGLAVFIVWYGLFIVIFQPTWWKLPY